LIRTRHPPNRCPTGVSAHCCIVLPSNFERNLQKLNPLQKQYQYNFSGNTQGNDPRDAFFCWLLENYIKSYNLLHYVTNYTNTTWTISWGSSSKNYPMANTHKHTHSLNYATVLEFSRNLRDVSIGWHWVCECMNN